jgi:hypothetical protein
MDALRPSAHRGGATTGSAPQTVSARSVQPTPGGCACQLVARAQLRVTAGWRAGCTVVGNASRRRSRRKHDGVGAQAWPAAVTVKRLRTQDTVRRSHHTASRIDNTPPSAPHGGASQHTGRRADPRAGNTAARSAARNGTTLTGTSKTLRKRTREARREGLRGRPELLLIEHPHRRPSSPVTARG